MTFFNRTFLCRAPDDSSGSDTQLPVIKRLEALIAPLNRERSSSGEVSIYSIVKQDQKIIFMENSQAVADWKVDNPKIEQHVRLMLGLEPQSPAL
jgi:hypothetical protein